MKRFSLKSAKKATGMNIEFVPVDELTSEERSDIFSVSAGLRDSSTGNWNELKTNITDSNGKVYTGIPVADQLEDELITSIKAYGRHHNTVGFLKIPTALGVDYLPVSIDDRNKAGKSGKAGGFFIDEPQYLAPASKGARTMVANVDRAASVYFRVKTTTVSQDHKYRLAAELNHQFGWEGFGAVSDMQKQMYG